MAKAKTKGTDQTDELILLRDVLKAQVTIPTDRTTAQSAMLLEAYNRGWIADCRYCTHPRMTKAGMEIYKKHKEKL